MRSTIEDVSRSEGHAVQDGQSATHIRDRGRRDRLLFLSALAHTLVTLLLGAAAEVVGCGRLRRRIPSRRIPVRCSVKAPTGSRGLLMMSVKILAPLLRVPEAQFAKHLVFKQLLGVLQE